MKMTAYILIGQADPEREAVGLDDLRDIRTVVHVVQTSQVPSQLSALLQGLVPGQWLGQNLVCQIIIHLIIHCGLVVLLFGF